MVQGTRGPHRDPWSVGSRTEPSLPRSMGDSDFWSLKQKGNTVKESLKKKHWIGRPYGKEIIG